MKSESAAMNGRPNGNDLDHGPRVTAREKKLRALYDGSGLPSVRGEAPRVAIVGAGLAGLTAATLLDRAGCRTAVFEASNRIGGRVLTERAGGAEGSVVECGGEFIDTQHVDMLALVRYLGLPMLDLEAPTEGAPLQGAYFFGGQRYTESEFERAFARLAPQIQADVNRCSSRASRRRHTPVDLQFDRMSVREYLQGLDTESWVRQALEMAYVTVYGLEADEQSSLNLLSLIGADTRRGVAVFGDSDERYKVRNGSEQVTAGLAQRLAGKVHLGHRLVDLRRRGSHHLLTLQRNAAGTVEVPADAVVLALPFTLLRQVELNGLFSPHKRRAITELGYGTNSKLMLGLRRRVWVEQGLEGGIYTDRGFQTTWECSRQRVADPAIFTFYLGGREGLAVGQGSPEEQARRYAAQADHAFPGFSASLTGLVRRIVWAQEPFALGSYTCYRPGQWTAFGGEEATPEGGVYFAGEHCATASQGYMDGAVATGRAAAQAFLRRFS
jgi:monoamine oxidase